MTWRLPRALALLALPLALAAGACSERLDTAAGCPVLCPGQTLDILDTVIDPAVVLDTTLSGFPLQGEESPLLLARRGDSLDVRAIVRFDTLVRRWTPAGDTVSRAITYVDSASLQFRLIKGDYKIPDQFVVEAYDVTDTTLADTLPANLLPLFVPGRLLGSRTIDSAAFKDSAVVSVPLDSAFVRGLITAGRGLRVGLRLTSAEAAVFYLTPSDDGTNGPRLRYRISADTLIAPRTVLPSSRTPATPSDAKYRLLDYSLVAAGSDPRAAGRFAVGGLPSVRSYLRFDIPRYLTDSAAVLRAQLELVQDPVRGMDDDIAFIVRAHLVLAGRATTDLHRAARLLAPLGLFADDSLRLTPRDSGVVRLEINALFRAWRTTDGLTGIPQALVLRADDEALSASGVRFFGRDAAPALRPRIRVSYVPTIRFGRP